MRFHFLLALPLATFLGVSPIQAQGASVTGPEAAKSAPRAKPIEPMVPPVRRVKPVTPPPSREIVGVGGDAKPRAGKGKASHTAATCGKRQKGAAGCPAARTPKVASKPRGKAATATTGKVAGKGAKVTSRNSKPAGNAAGAPAPANKQAAAQTGPTR